MARHRESIPAKKLTFRALIHYAKDEGEVTRASQPSLKPIRSNRSSDLLLAEESDPPTAKRSVSFDTDQLDSSTVSGTPTVEEDLNYIRHVPPASLAFGDARTAASRPGWINRQPIICYDCYEKGHLAPKCTLRVAELKHVVVNYEALTDEEKAIVPDASYKAAIEYVTLKEKLKSIRNQSAAHSPSPSSDPPSIRRPSGNAPPPNPELKKG